MVRSTVCGLCTWLGHVQKSNTSIAAAAHFWDFVFAP